MNNLIEQIQREEAHELFGLKLEDVLEADRGKVRSEMWNKFCPALGKARLADMNKKNSPRGYGLLCGQPEFMDMLWFREFPLTEVARALFVTDGLIPWSVMKSKSDDEVAYGVLAAYKAGGF